MTEQSFEGEIGFHSAPYEIEPLSERPTGGGGIPPAATAAVNRRAMLGSVPSDPHSSVPPDEQNRGADPYLAIQDPELRLAVMCAHRQWAERYCPWLLERWLND